MKRFSWLLLLSLILVACAPSQAGSDLTPPQAVLASTNTPIPTEEPALAPPPVPDTAENTDLIRIDEQGAVIVEVTPLNLDASAEALEFDVAMNTHSIDLSMDLAALATLATDTGVVIQATTWDAPGGGHHVSGKLLFPANKDGQSALEGASKLTLTIINVDVPSRVFEWELN